MSKQSRVDETIASGQESIARSHQRREQERRDRDARIKKRRQAQLLGKLKRMAATVGVIIVGAMLFGLFFRGLGFAGLVITVGLIIASLIYLARQPTVIEPQSDELTTIDLAQLADRTEHWLESQYLALPAPAQYVLDDMGDKLSVLSPQLQGLDPNSGAARSIRRLLAEDLPALVQGYRAVPAPMRRKQNSGQTPDQQLCSGLELISGEIESATNQLAQGKLDELATQSRFLEMKYPGKDSEN